LEVLALVPFTWHKAVALLT